MSRLQQYRQQMGAAHVAIPGAVRVAGPPQGADGASRALATAIDGAVGMGMKLAAREHVRDQQTRMEERLLAARKEFGEWREQYRQTHQGGDALDAGAAFQAKFAEIAGRHLAAFGGAENEIFRQQLGGRLAAAGVLAAEEGAAWAASQRRIWEQSVREGRLAQLEQDAYANPANTAWLDMQMDGVIRDEAARGRDATALRRSLASRTRLTRIRGLVDRGDLDGAARLLGDGGVGSRSERNLSAHNYGNVKNTSGGFHAYATRADGLMGVGERVLRYANAPDRGWHARTLRQMVDIYAPASDGNDPARYAAFLGERLGVRPDAEVDFRNPDVLAGLIRHMPVMEHGRGAAVTEAEAREAANRLLAGERPRIVGSAPGDAPGNAPDMTPEDAATARGLIERQRAKLAAATAEQVAREVAAAMPGGSLTEMEAAAYDRVAAVGDPKLRAAAWAAVGREIAFRKQREDARAALEVERLVAEGRQRKLSPLEFDRMIRESGAADGVQSRASAAFYGTVSENPANMAALEDLRRRIDEAVFDGRSLSDEAVLAYGYDRRMTPGQTRAALAYRDAGGALSEVTRGAALTQWRTLHPDRTEKDFPKWLLPAIGIMQRQRPGKPYTDYELRALIARLEMEGSVPRQWWFGRKATAWGEALADGSLATWKEKEKD